MALSMVYALMASPGASTSNASLTAPSPEASSLPIHIPLTSAEAAFPSAPSIPILDSPHAFDNFVLSANAAGCLVCVLFHAPWCRYSKRMDQELQRLMALFSTRRIVFARVDCATAAPGGSGGGARRSPLAELHRIHSTPTVRMYHAGACVDEVTGCRPVDFRQALGDLSFKYAL